MFVADDLDQQYELISNQSRLFDNIINCTADHACDSVEISYELWQQIYNEYKWLINHKGILQCSICQEGYNKYPNLITQDGWVCVNRYSYVKYDKQSLALILRVHNFSENHLKSQDVLKNNKITITAQLTNGVTQYKNLSPKLISNLNPSIISVQSNAPKAHQASSSSMCKSGCLVNTYPTSIAPCPSLAPKPAPTSHNNINSGIISSSYYHPQQQQQLNYPSASLQQRSLITTSSTSGTMHSYNPWAKYMDIYRWLCVTNHNNPACSMCQKAAQISPKMFRTKWTHPDKTTNYTVNYDRPQRTLIQHHHSTNHRLAEEILGENSRLKEFAADHKPPEDCKDVPLNMFSQETWDKYLDKYPWLYYSEREASFHCIYCEKAYSQYSSRMKATVWTNLSDARESVFDKARARKLLNDHQRSFNHNVAEELLRCGGNSKLSYPHCQPKILGGATPDELEEYRIDYHSDSSGDGQFKQENETIGLASSSNQAQAPANNGNTEHSHSNGHNNSIVDINDDSMSTLDNTNRTYNNNSFYSLVSYPEDPPKKIESDQWQRLCDKYRWLFGTNGVSYGCKACQKAYNRQPDSVPMNNWSRGSIPFTSRSNYMHLRKKFYQHNCCTKHRACVTLLANKQQHKMMICPSSTAGTTSGPGLMDIDQSYSPPPLVFPSNDNIDLGQSSSGFSQHLLLKLPKSELIIENIDGDDDEEDAVINTTNIGPASNTNSFLGLSVANDNNKNHHNHGNNTNSDDEDLDEPEEDPDDEETEVYHNHNNIKHNINLNNINQSFDDYPL